MIKGHLLQFYGCLTYIDYDAIDLQHPNHRVIDELTGQRPFWLLVDALQEWDRYTDQGESAFSETELLQSYQTKLKVGKEFSSYFSASIDITDDEENLNIIGELPQIKSNPETS